MNASALQKKYGFENPFVTDPLVRKAIRHCRGTHVLDVGCGEGADSVCYAKKGFTVTAIDQNAAYLKRLRAYRDDRKLSRLHIVRHNVVTHRYPRDEYDVVSCILVVCCMKKSEFETLVPKLKRTVRPGGIIIMSARNYLDPELHDYQNTARELEPNTFRHEKDCCTFVYFLEKGRLQEMFNDFRLLYCYEGYAPCKYHEHPRHGDSYIICQRIK
ncbi:MAG: methyltransferase domain-containing protein [Bacteroidota bacterium]